MTTVKVKKRKIIRPTGRKLKLRSASARTNHKFGKDLAKLSEKPAKRRTSLTRMNKLLDENSDAVFAAAEQNAIKIIGRTRL